MVDLRMLVLNHLRNSFCGLVKVLGVNFYVFLIFRVCVCMIVDIRLCVEVFYLCFNLCVGMGCL